MGIFQYGLKKEKNEEKRKKNARRLSVGLWDMAVERYCSSFNTIVITF